MGLDHWQVTPTCRVRLHPPHLTELPASTRCLSSARVSPNEDRSPFPMALEAQSRALASPRPCPAPLVLPLLFQASGSSHTLSPLKCLPFPLHPAKSCTASFKSPLRRHLLRAALCGFSCTSLTCCPRIDSPGPCQVTRTQTKPVFLAAGPQHPVECLANRGCSCSVCWARVSVVNGPEAPSWGTQAGL